MSARDDAVQAMDDFDSAWCRDGALYGRKYWGEMLDAIPNDVLARLAVERGVIEQLGYVSIKRREFIAQTDVGYRGPVYRLTEALS